MEKILVPIDFSPASRNASEYAASLAKVFNAEMRLLHVFMEPTAVIEGSTVAWSGTGNELQEKNDSLVQNEINFLRENYSVNIGGYARVGFKTDKISDVINEIQADLVVMGPGNTALSTIRKVSTPILLVPESASFVPIKHVVFACDFNEVNDVSCFNPLLEFVDRLGAMLLVLHVKRNNNEMLAVEEPGMLQLQNVLSKITFWYKEVQADSVENGIENFIESHPAELLVMVAHTHNVFERIFGTVHTSSMSYETNLPLLVLEDK